ncbi:MAG: P1 family peptidase [Chloroflexota bacterium]
MRDAITDVPGIKVGHYTDTQGVTGCTVVLCEAGATAGVDVRGSAPGTRETDLLRPTTLVQQVHAVLLSGGSAFGLDAATGVMRYLEERGRGFDTTVAKVPIVPAAILFDLSVGDPKARPDAASGYSACQAASDGPVAQGSVGAGTGASVGKALGIQRATKGGLGTASYRLGSQVVAALMVASPFGDVVEPDTGRLLAGPWDEGGRRMLSTLELIRHGTPWQQMFPQNTVIGVVATNACLTKEQCTKLAQMAQDGLARAVRPAHTMLDGDVIFALALGRGQPLADVTAIGAVAADLVAQAIVRGVTQAHSLGGLPSCREVEVI